MGAKHNPIDTLHIPEARYVADGKTVLVQPALPGERLRPGRDAYNPDIHYMKLLCPYCDVRVDFNKGSGILSCGTQLKGSRPHLKTAPEQEHGTECKLPKTKIEESNSEIDEDAPFRIHLERVFTSKSDVIYERAQHGKVVAHDARLKPVEVTVKDESGQDKVVKRYREIVKAKSAQDFIDLMSRGEVERVRKADIVNNTIVGWDHFFIRNEERMQNLVSRLLKGASHPVLLQVGLNKAARGPFVDTAKVFYNRDAKGPHFVTPRLYLDGPDMDAVFPDAGRYVVLGLPRVHFNERSGQYLLNISVKDKDCVAPYAPEAIKAALAERAVREPKPRP